MKRKPILGKGAVLAGFLLLTGIAKAQTADDALMMGKKQWCNGLTYTYSSWTNYWEGTLKRDNLNLGKVTTQSVMLMSNYGITNKLNLIVGLPYVWTNASAGTLHGLKGIQDIMVDLKYEFLKSKVGKEGRISLFGVAGFSTPLSNYENDFLPMSIGIGSTTASLRLTADYQKGIFFTTLSGDYVFRGDVSVERTAYYSDSYHQTSNAYVPNQLLSNLFVGIRKPNLVVQAQVYNMYTFGGTDIRRNDMPFVSNQMNMTTVGAHVKYFLPFLPSLQVVGGADFVVAGRNVGQAQIYNGGLYYIVSL
jgi:hypothetical protein